VGKVDWTIKKTLMEPLKKTMEWKRTLEKGLQKDVL